MELILIIVVLVLLFGGGGHYFGRSGDKTRQRTHLIHRPARDIIPPFGGVRVSSYRM